jgi:hypothetical protein
MIDAEVLRLRHLRRVALVTRKLAQTIHSNLPDDEVFARSAVTAWGVARLMNGRLISHPNLSYQQGRNLLDSLTDNTLSLLTGFVAAKQRRAYTVFAQQRQILSRELDDTRALTWSADLSDALGRAQWQLVRAMQDLSAGLRREGGAVPESLVKAPTSQAARPADWPYLAI